MKEVKMIQYQCKFDYLHKIDKIVQELSRVEIVYYALNSWDRDYLRIIGEFTYLSNFYEELSDTIFRIKISPELFIDKPMCDKIIESAKGIKNFELVGGCREENITLEEWYKPTLIKRVQKTVDADYGGWCDKNYTEEVVNNMIATLPISISERRVVNYNDYCCRTLIERKLYDYITELNNYKKVVSEVEEIMEKYSGVEFLNRLNDLYAVNDLMIFKLSMLIKGGDTYHFTKLLKDLLELKK